MAMETMALLALSITCWMSFALAIIWHFARPAEPSWRMKAVAILGTLFGVLQVAMIVTVPTVSWLSWTGALVLYGLAMLLFWWAVWVTRGHRFPLAFSPSSPTILLVEGPYRWVRHPFYASYLLYWIAGVCATEAWWLIVSAVVMGGLYWSAAAQEEREFLQSQQAEAYRAYVAQTGRFVPKLLRWHQTIFWIGRHKLFVKECDRLSVPVGAKNEQ